MNLLVDIENMVADFGWETDWVDDNEFVAIADGKWCVYQIHFIWQKPIGALYIVFCTDLRFEEPYNIDLLRFIIAANQRLWMGHFDLLEDGAINYRHVIHLYNTDDECTEKIKEISFVMFSEFDLFYPGFQKIQNHIPLSPGDIDLLSLEIRGKA
ncbi:MAG: YbjN domain-containing protein [Candidatus Paracaedibacteraceae bacterium]|nr:YbjN domain-containing protein [Candidatus Paracaedibacteraceae bacterium]